MIEKERTGNKTVQLFLKICTTRFSAYSDRHLLFIIINQLSGAQGRNRTTDTAIFSRIRLCKNNNTINDLAEKLYNPKCSFPREHTGNLYNSRAPSLCPPSARRQIQHFAGQLPVSQIFPPCPVRQELRITLVDSGDCRVTEKANHGTSSLDSNDNLQDRCRPGRC